MLLLAAAAAAAVRIAAGAAPKAGPESTPQETYIARYSAMAVSEMYRSGVPASITLAQGLLESRYGESPLAVEGNNHFGIKCNNWKGKTMKHDDDRRNECFRVYDSAEESYRDHSDFLRYRDRYKFLFENDVTDYRSWAYGLKKAGYATDPEYPAKLIRLIEDYRLYEYDTTPQAGTEEIRSAAEPSSPESRPADRDAGKKKKQPRVKKKKTDGKAVAGTEAGTVAEPAVREIPESPLSLEQPETYAFRKGESFRFPISRQVYSRNGVPFIYTLEGETLSSIAEAHDLFLRELLKFNDMDKVETLAPGTVVYLQPKKSRSVKGLEKYIVDHDGESLRDIAQRFAVRLEALEKMNGFGRGTELREGDTVILRAENA